MPQRATPDAPSRPTDLRALSPREHGLWCWVGAPLLGAALRVGVGWAGGPMPLYVATAAPLVAAFVVWLARFGPVASGR